MSTLKTRNIEWSPQRTQFLVGGSELKLYEWFPIVCGSVVDHPHGMVQKLFTDYAFVIIFPYLSTLFLSISIFSFLAYRLQLALQDLERLL